MYVRMYDRPTYSNVDHYPKVGLIPLALTIISSHSSPCTNVLASEVGGVALKILSPTPLFLITPFFLIPIPPPPPPPPPKRKILYETLTLVYFFIAAAYSYYPKRIP